MQNITSATQTKKKRNTIDVVFKSPVICNRKWLQVEKTAERVRKMEHNLLRTVCIGVLTSFFMKMIVRFEQTMSQKISLLSVISPQIFSKTTLSR